MKLYLHRFGSPELRKFCCRQPEAQLPAWAAENLPLGLAMDAATGTISRIPIVAGEYTVTVSVSDNDGASVEKDITMKVNTYRTLIISTSTLPAAHISEAYSATLEADGGKAPYSGVLPDFRRLSIDPGTGIITGVTVNDGTYNVSITVEDSLGTSKGKPSMNCRSGCKNNNK